MIFFIPVIGWAIGAAFSLFVSIPFYFLWNGLAQTYFYFMPEVYKHLPFWDCVGLFMLISILKTLFPTFSTSSSSAGKS